MPAGIPAHVEVCLLRSLGKNQVQRKSVSIDGSVKGHGFGFGAVE